jgi:hypothetical protein
MRSRPKKSKKAATAAQQHQRDAFKLVVEFLKPLTPVINVGYQRYQQQKSPMNTAVAYHLENAVTGTHPLIGIDYSKVMLSTGLLPAASTVAPVSATAMSVTFEWNNDADPDATALTDTLTFVVYNPVKKRVAIATAAALRQELLYTMLLPANFSGDEVQCYLLFVSDNGKQVSNSIYMGAVEVA